MTYANPRRHNARHQAEYRARCLAAGICRDCGEPAKPGRLRCAACVEAMRVRRAEARAA